MIIDALLRLTFCLNVTVAVEAIAMNSVLWAALNVGTGLAVLGVLVQRRAASR